MPRQVNKKPRLMHCDYTRLKNRNISLEVQRTFSWDLFFCGISQWLHNLYEYYCFLRYVPSCIWYDVSRHFTTTTLMTMYTIMGKCTMTNKSYLSLYIMFWKCTVTSYSPIQVKFYS